MQSPEILNLILLMFILSTTNKYVVFCDSESENLILIEMSTTDNIIDSRVQLDESDDEMNFSDEKDEVKLFMKDIQQLSNISNADEIRQKAAIHRVKLKNLRLLDAVRFSNYLKIKSRKTALKSEVSELQLLIWLEQMLREYHEDFDLHEWTELNPQFVANKTLINLHSSWEDKNKEYERQRWIFFLTNPPSKKMEKLNKFMNTHSNVFCIEDFATVVSEFHSRVSKFQKTASHCDEALVQPLEVFMFDDDEENIAVLLLMQGVSIPNQIKIMIRKEMQSKSGLMLLSYDIFKTFSI